MSKKCQSCEKKETCSLYQFQKEGIIPAIFGIGLPLGSGGDENPFGIPRPFKKSSCSSCGRHHVEKEENAFDIIARKIENFWDSMEKEYGRDTIQKVMDGMMKSVEESNDENEDSDETDDILESIDNNLDMVNTNLETIINLIVQNAKKGADISSDTFITGAAPLQILPTIETAIRGDDKYIKKYIKRHTKKQVEKRMGRMWIRVRNHINEKFNQRTPNPRAFEPKGLHSDSISEPVFAGTRFQSLPESAHEIKDKFEPNEKKCLPIDGQPVIYDKIVDPSDNPIRAAFSTRACNNIHKKEKKDVPSQSGFETNLLNDKRPFNIPDTTTDETPESSQEKKEE